MRIQALAQQTGVPARTIRFYETIGLLPPPQRQPNGYRDYTLEDVERLRLVAGARRLGLALEDIRQILALRDRHEAPCRTLLIMLEHKAEEIAHLIRDLQHLEQELRALHALGITLSLNDIEGKDCICHLISAQPDPTFTIPNEEPE
ncbi:MAG: heavy metal-responsive transcriptional regulator [Thermanaerothrix sp.]|uniref:heavy metal-responsive transcriptional regulator n=1 Tax=Thermanaerothrix sp. TaxID=2972675 RepID=UPI003C79A8ED